MIEAIPTERRAAKLPKDFAKEYRDSLKRSETTYLGLSAYWVLTLVIAFIVGISVGGGQ